MNNGSSAGSVASPILLTGVVQHYSWGKPGDTSLVSRYAGINDSTRPCAELWFGTHPKGPTTLFWNDSNQILRDLVRQNPGEILGTHVVEKFGAELPFLFKVLSINEALSIQSHPSKTTNPWAGIREMPHAFSDTHAGYLHWKDPQHYPDDNHKPEIAVALTHLSLLHGFKPVDELLASFSTNPELTALIGADRIQGLAQATDVSSQAAAVREIYRAVVQSTPEDRATHMAAFHARLLTGQTTMTWERAHLEKMFATYGAADVGIPTSLLMNWRQVAPGDGVYIRPNELHAYLEGDLIECMATSDNVVRAGLTQKFQDTEELLAMVDTTPALPVIVTPEPVAGSKISSLYRTPAAEFQVIAVRGEHAEKENFTAAGATFVLCTSGSLNVETAAGAMGLSEGQLVLIPAQATRFTLTCNGGKGFVISVPA